MCSLFVSSCWCLVLVESLSPSNNVVIRLKDVHKSFGDKAILKGVNLDVVKGKSVAVMGGSGTGKSVLLKHIVKLVEPETGRVQVEGRWLRDVDEKEMNAIRLRVGYLFQGGALFDSMTVEENLNFILRRHTSLDPVARAERIGEALSCVHLYSKARQFPAELSGGQRKRVALARATVLGPDILLCDEPTTGLDPVSVRTVSDLIVYLRDERGATVVSITHDLLCAEIISDEVHFLHDGRVIESGDFATVKGSPNPILREFFLA